MTCLNLRLSLKLIISLIFMILLLYPVKAAAQDPPPADAAPFDPHFGLVDSFVNTAEANAAGAGWTRVFFRWDVVQPGGPSDWKPTNVPDTFIEAEVAAGREIAAVLIGTPGWAAESGLSTAVPPPEFWGDFVFKIASQYKGRVTHWIIWNQPDINDPASPNFTWAGNEADYYHLLKEAYLKIKAVDPAMQVHLAGLTYTWDQEQGTRQYLARLLDAIQAEPEAANHNYYFDAVTYHLYYNPRQIYEVLTAVQETLEARGMGDKEIWLAETNAPPSQDPLEPNLSPGIFNITLEEQSAFVIQTSALALAGGADRIAFYKLRSDTTDPFGLLRSDGSRRPAFEAFRAVTTHFAGVQRVDLQQVDSVVVVTLDRGGQTTTVLWNTAPRPVSFALPSLAPSGLLVDERAGEQPLSPDNGVYTLELPGAVCSNGGNCFIGGAPRLVVETGSPGQRAALSAPAPVAVDATPAPTATVAVTPTLAPTAAPPPTLTPEPAPGPLTSTVSNPLPAESGLSGASSSTGSEPGAIPAALPEPGRVGGSPEAAATMTGALPPLTFSSVMSPRRILWLFVIGLLVFTISYGIQVAIWYRLKK